MKIHDQVKALAHEKHAVILAHNYQSVAIQEMADYTGDSLQLSILASKTEAEIIVFCGVRFMAETAAILNPRARVLLPAPDAGCPMADMITAEQLREFKAAYPDAVVVCYVNSSVEVKAESDICCTSSNAVRVIRSIPPERNILFVPDQNLGSWAARQSGREVITWNGFCPVHHWGFQKSVLDRLRRKYPNHKLLAHPECDEDIVNEADHVMSTSGMINYVQDHDNLIIATDAAMVDYLKHRYPGKHILPLSNKARCRNMQKTTPALLLEALKKEQHLVQVDPKVAAKAINSLNRMLALKD
jgi:quinolinate synthase